MSPDGTNYFRINFLLHLFHMDKNMQLIDTLYGLSATVDNRCISKVTRFLALRYSKMVTRSVFRSVFIMEWLD